MVGPHFLTQFSPSFKLLYIKDERAGNKLRLLPPTFFIAHNSG